jgi:hypothetical protein
MEKDSGSVTLKLKPNQAIDHACIDGWKNIIRAAGSEIRTIIFDFSQVNEVPEADVSSLARQFGPPSKTHGWQMMVMCVPEVEQTFSKLGLDGMFTCLHVHGKAEPTKDIFSDDNTSSALRQELSVFFSNLVAAYERISSALFGAPLKFTPPMAVLTDLKEATKEIENGAIIRMESGAMNYRLVFLVSAADKERLGAAAFQGRDVSPDVLNDLISELANNTMGDLVSQLGRTDPAILLRSDIPERTTNQILLSEDVTSMKGKVLLQFTSGDSKMKVLVGYNLRC